MNFVQGAPLMGGGAKQWRFFVSWILVILSLGLLGGCSDRVRMPTHEQLAAFAKADPITSRVDMQRVEEARLQVGPYRVVPGDVLEFTMPALLQAVTVAEIATTRARTQEDHPHLCRVDEGGTIELPGVGPVFVAGMSLSQIEVAVANTYRQHVALRPSVFVRVFEYKTFNVYVTGAVEKPGVYDLRGDQMTLAHLLKEAGGILMRDAGGALMREGGGISGPGAALIRISSLDQGAGGPRPVDRRSVGGLSAHSAGGLTLRDPGDGRIAISFTADGAQSTVGRLVLSRGPQVLLEERTDLASEFQRRVALGKLSALDHDCSILELESRLIALAGSLGEGAGAPKIAAWSDPQVVGHPGAAPSPQEHAVVLPVYGLNIPFTNVALREGDTVIVERLQVPMFSVVGLVRSPGNFPYPPDIQYNLMQAVAFAGGIDPVAAPRYATIYRLLADGSIARVPFRLVKDGEFTEAMTTPIKPGDVVALEHTPRTRTNTIIHNMVRFNTGLYLTGNDLWGR